MGGEGWRWQCHSMHPPSASPGSLRLRAQHERPAATADLAVHHGAGTCQPGQVRAGAVSGQGGETAARSLTCVVSLLQAAEGPLLGSPAPALLCCHELLPLPTLPGGVGGGADPGGTMHGCCSMLGCSGPHRGLCPEGLGLTRGWCVSLCLPGWGICSTLPLHFLCLSLQTLLSECVAPHMDDLGTVSASASAPAAFLCKMFK